MAAGYVEIAIFQGHRIVTAHTDDTYLEKYQISIPDPSVNRDAHEVARC